MKAGRKRIKTRRKPRRKSRRGGNVLLNAAVPASLIYALNKKYGKKKAGKARKRTRRRRGKRRRGGNATEE